MRSAFALLIISATVWLSAGSIGNAQIYKFRQYGIDKGICHHTVYAITQDNHGYIWFATGMGLCRYDGFRFVTPDVNLPSTNVATAFKDSIGNLWFGYNDGLLIRYDGFDFSVVDTSQSKTSVNQIIQGPKGEILAATQTEGITKVTADNRIERLSLDLTNGFIYSICFAGSDKLLVGCQDGLFLYNYRDDVQNLTLFAKPDSLSDIAVPAIIPQTGGGGYWIATEDDGIWHLAFNGEQPVVRSLHIPELADVRVQSIYEDDQKNLWVSTFGKGLFRVRLSNNQTVEKVYNYNSSNGLGSDYIKQVFFDNRRNLWVGTTGQGAAGLTNLAVSFFETIDPAVNNATAVLSTNNSEYWIAGRGAVIRVASEPGKTSGAISRINGIPNDGITSLYLDEKGILWISTEKNGIYKSDNKKNNSAVPFFRSENSLDNNIQAIASLGNDIWVASRNGVLVIDTQTGKIVDRYNTNDGLPHNNIRDIFKDSKNAIWIATNSNSVLAVNEDRRHVLENEGETEFSAITEDADGNIWAGTLGKGVYLFDEKNDTVYNFSARNGLKSDYCYAAVFDGIEHVWVGHRLGVSRINIKRKTVTVYGPENGLTGDVNPNAMTVNKSGEILVGMTDGVMVYDLNTDRTHDQAPMLNLVGVTIGDKSYRPDKPVTLSYGRYKVQFDFIGLQYSNPESVTYQYVLQGYDSEWSEPTNLNSAVYPRLEDGNYKLWVRACNSENCTEETMLFTLKIRKPFWKTWWFILSMIAATVGGVYLIIMVRERNHRIQQEYLERELAARTKEVREQKEEIEAKNRDITDSINYAQRIQFSVLPSTSTLLEQCSGAFIFYRPRDIVSGDFYWFDHFPESHRLLVVCADSTGHGVPGAFMSLIGTTLIKDIAERPEIQTPADILYRLDENIQSTLNQNQESEHANDGMDIIVCDINTETKYVKIASAMRPFIIYQNGVPTAYKCSRSSIGGQPVKNKVFDTTEVQLSVGDTIYMFTDGYTDQFGGPSGKKFKMNRLQNILDDIHTRDMEEQHRVVKANFDLWKGSLDQVDDVLLIGVKL